MKQDYNFTVYTSIETARGEPELQVVGTIYPGDPGKSGPCIAPEDSYPPDPGDFEVHEIYLLRGKKKRRIPRGVEVYGDNRATS